MTDLLVRLQAALADRYAIERELGHGGMAVVFLAQDLKHHRRVALKVLRPELAAAMGPERFLREIETAAQLTHPHILALHDSGEADGFLYYVMPYVEGESLRQRLDRERQLPLDDALQIARDVAHALGYAHSLGVVHRDIKPENVLLCGGEAVVADFGIARAISAAGGDKLTQTGAVVGTPAYMSPEQTVGSGQLDGRSDLYSLGCVLYEMLAGEPPFTGPTAESVLHQHLAAAARSVTVLRPTVPAQVVQALERALAKAPADRFASAHHFAEALAGAAAARAPARATESRNSIAVLPFANMSPESENEYFSDGMTDELIHHLAKVEGLRVASRTSAFAFKGKEADIRAIGAQLSVATILEGSVRKAGNKLRVTTQLINVADGYHLWSETYERELHDVFAIQEGISRAIVDALKIKLVGAPGTPLVKRYTDDVEAYHLYLQGRYLWNRRTAEDLQKAVRCFEAAVERDPHYARAYAGLADSFTLLGSAGYGSLSPLAAFPKAKAAASRALELDDTLAEAHASLAWQRFRLDWDWSAAAAGFERAIELNPSYATAHHWYALFLTAMGRLEEALAEISRALELDPLSLIIHTALGRILHFARQYDRAAAQCLRTIELDPNFAEAHFDLGLTYLQEARFEEAVAELQTAFALSRGRPVLQAILGYAYAVAGRKAEAEQVRDDLKRLSQGTYVSPLDLAYISIGLGDREQTFELLEMAYAERAGLLVYLEVEPIFDPLRSDPRFRDLTRRMRLPP